jgi:hypothetical protein
VQEQRSLFDKYSEKREALKRWAERKAQEGADSLTHPIPDPIAAARSEELRRATEGTGAERAGRDLADRDIAQGFNDTAVEGAGIAAREGTEIALQAAETEAGVRGLGMAAGALRGPVHHLATNKNRLSTARGGPWTPRFQEVFEGAGYGLDDAINKVRVPGHAGPHPEAYHQAVFDRLVSSVQGLRRGTDQYRAAFEAEMQAIRQEAATRGTQLNKLLKR